MKKQLVINGMSCGHCSSRVKSTLEEVDGVTDVNVDLGKKTATFVSSNELSDDMFISLIQDIGYEVVEIK